MIVILVPIIVSLNVYAFHEWFIFTFSIRISLFFYKNVQYVCINMCT